jgi:hypothetical protein
MASLTEYFERTIPKPRYQFGDRVQGVYMGVPGWPCCLAIQTGHF